MQITTYQEAREYLESFIRPSIYARVDVEPDTPHPLKRMAALLKLLGNPHKQFRSVQVSGTSGKGSTSYLLAHTLTCAGYKTGLTLSPHLEKITERMQVNTVAIADEEFITLLNEIIPTIEHMKTHPLGEPSYFEILLALAFVYFAKQQVAIAIIEVGLEGRLDGTNVLDPLVAVITTIDLDHTEILGNTVEKIAGEAVSIIKTHQQGELRKQFLVTGVKQKSVLALIRKTCKAAGADIEVLGRDVTYVITESTKDGSVFSYNSTHRSLEALSLSLVGGYQVENATLALAVVDTLTQFGFTVPDEKLRQALRTATFPGRFETLPYLYDSQTYTLLLDGAHNPIKMHSFLAAVMTFYPYQKKHFIVSCKKGKDSKAMLSAIVKVADSVTLTEFHRTIDTAKNAAMRATVLRNGVKHASISLQPTADTALRSVLHAVSPDDLIIVTGSLYLVGEIRELVMQEAALSIGSTP